MNPARQRPIRYLLRVVDGVIVAASMPLAFWLQSLLRGLSPILQDPAPMSGFLLLGYLTVPVWIALVVALGLDRVFERLSTRTEVVVGLLKLHGLGAIFLTVLLFATQIAFNRSIAALFFASTFSLMLVERLVLGRWVRYQHDSTQNRVRLLLVGDGGADMLDFLTTAASARLAPLVIGYLGSPRPVAPEAAPEAAPQAVAEVEGNLPPRLGAPSELHRVLHDEAVDEVVFFAPFDRALDQQAALESCSELGVPANFAVQGPRGLGAEPRVLSLYGTPFVTYSDRPKRPEWLALKQAADTIFAALGLVLLLPLLLLTALSIWITMGRPIVFTQERIGLFGRRFKMFKFRTMVLGAASAEPVSGAGRRESVPVSKVVACDPRITPLGRLLRRSSIDELPQLVNVLLGRMSLVGPRPLPVHEQQRIRGPQRRRLAMKPGITGLWQVSGRSDVDFARWMELDLKYIDEWSPLLDLRILCDTIPAVLLGRGAR